MCSFSPTPNHLVVQSFYNNMMGEFYARTLLGLQQLLRAYPPHSNDDIQTYIHFVDERWQLLEGHELFLSGLPNNNKVLNFLSVMPRNESCQCFRRLVFCGYTTTESSSVGEQYVRSFNDTGDEHQNATVLLPTGVIATLNYTSSAWHDLRTDLISGISGRYDDLNGRVRQYQRRVLIDRGLIRSNDKDAGNNFEDEWKFVGLARQKYRRSWLNLNDTLSMCNERF